MSNMVIREMKSKDFVISFATALIMFLLSFFLPKFLHKASE